MSTHTRIVFHVIAVHSGLEFTTRTPHSDYSRACAYAEHLAACGWPRALVRTPAGTVLHTATRKEDATHGR